MGLSTAFLTGFVGAANRDMYQKRMAAHEESVEARADFQWRQRRDEEDAREDELLADSIALEDQRLKDSQTYEAGLLVNEIAAQRTEDDRLAAKRAPIIAELHPEFTPEQVDMWSRQSETAFNNLISQAHDGETWLAAENRFTNQIEVKINDANILVDTMRPSDMAEGILVGTPWGRMLQQNFLQGKNTQFLEQQGYTPNYIRDENGVIIGAEVVYADPDMYEPDQYEYNNLSSAANRVLAVINDMTPGDLILDSEFNILQGDLARAFHNLEQLASDRYVKGKGRIRENKAVDSVFTKERLELLAELTDTRMELPNYFLALASDPASVESMMLDIQAMDDVDELLDIYNNLFARKELHRQEILPADEVAIDAVLLAISNNPTLMEYREAQAAVTEPAAAVEPVVEPAAAVEPGPVVEVEAAEAAEAAAAAIMNTEDGRTKMNAAVEAFNAQGDKETLGVGRLSKRTLEALIAEEFGIELLGAFSLWQGNRQSRNRENRRRAHLLDQLMKQLQTLEGEIE